MSNITKWGTFDLNAAKKEAEELAASGTSAFFKPKAGENTLRFLPPLAGRSSPFILVHQHFVKMPGMTKSASFNCPRVMGKRFCPVCAYAEKLRSTGNPADYETAGDFVAKLRVFALIIDRDAPDLGPQVFAYGKKIHEALLQIRESKAGGDFTNPVNGFDIIVHKTGSGKEGTEYRVLAARESTPIGDVAGLDAIPDIQRYGKVPTDDELAKILNMKPSGAQPPPERERKAEDVNTKLTTVDEDDVLAASTPAQPDAPSLVGRGVFLWRSRWTYLFASAVAASPRRQLRRSPAASTSSRRAIATTRQAATARRSLCALAAAAEKRSSAPGSGARTSGCSGTLGESMDTTARKAGVAGATSSTSTV